MVIVTPLQVENLNTNRYTHVQRKGIQESDRFDERFERGRYTPFIDLTSDEHGDLPCSALITTHISHPMMTRSKRRINQQEEHNREKQASKYIKRNNILQPTNKIFKSYT